MGKCLVKDKTCAHCGVTLPYPNRRPAYFKRGKPIYFCGYKHDLDWWRKMLIEAGERPLKDYGLSLWRPTDDVVVRGTVQSAKPL